METPSAVELTAGITGLICAILVAIAVLGTLLFGGRAHGRKSCAVGCLGTLLSAVVMIVATAAAAVLTGGL